MMYEDAKKLGRYDFMEKHGAHKEWLYDKIHGELIREILKESLESIDKWQKKERHMSRVSDMLMGMQEEASHITKEEFVSKYGWINENVWDDVHKELIGGPKLGRQIVMRFTSNF